MYCSKCGKKLPDNAKFCDGCGAKIVHDEPVVEEKKTTEAPAKQESVAIPPAIPPKNKEGQVHKCPYCGEILPFDAVKCPSCGREIRDREATWSVESLAEKLNATDDNDKKIELIKTFPIPNSREDILGFMIMASSNFDARYYATNSNADTVSGAWLSKIEECYTKGKIMFQDKKDLANLDMVYRQTHKKAVITQRLRIAMIVAGFVLTILSIALIGTDANQTTNVLSYVSIGILAVGIVLLVFGFKRKKTKKQIKEEKDRKEELEDRKYEEKKAKRKKKGFFRSLISPSSPEEDEDEDENDDN